MTFEISPSSLRRSARQLSVAVTLCTGLGGSFWAGAVSAQEASSPPPAAVVAAPALQATPAPSAAQTGPADAMANPGTVSEPAPETVSETASEAVRADLPHDLSPWGMFLAAHIVVKVVMAGLAAASLATWTIWLAKSVELFAARKRLGGTLRAIRGARTLDAALAANGARRGPASVMLRLADAEAKLSDEAVDHAGGEGLKERVAAALGRVEAGAGRRMAVGTGILATIGSVGPFVGLFGTVWGIMNAFIGISQAKTTNLAVVAPGIAEALLATAIGLVAAIPAVMIYNHFARATQRYRQMLADASVGVQILVSRDLDFRGLVADVGRPMTASAVRLATRAAAE